MEHAADGISVEDHLERILSTVEPLPPYETPLLDAVGLPAAQDVVAGFPLPAFDNSAMDGYAVVFRDVADATEDRPAHLPVVGEIAAGTADIVALSPGTTVRIMTGAPIPTGCNAVVPVEWTDDADDQVRVFRAPEEGQHIRRAGEEVATGDLVLRAGERIGPRQLGLLAALGLARVAAPARPRVVVLSTGSELIEPGRPPARDRVYDANSYLLASAARAAGAVAFRVGATSDDPAAFRETLSDQLVRADLVVTSGGVSKGTHDVVKEVLADLGTVWFGEVAMQPGKPQGFGVVGEDRTPIFALPGNPVSAYLSFCVFVLPALRAMTGIAPAVPPLQEAVLGEAVRSVPGRRQFLRARLERTETGLRVRPVGGPGSHLVAGLAAADAAIVLPEDVTSVQAGQAVQVMALDEGL